MFIECYRKDVFLPHDASKTIQKQQLKTSFDYVWTVWCRFCTIWTKSKHFIHTSLLVFIQIEPKFSQELCRKVTGLLFTPANAWWGRTDLPTGCDFLLRESPGAADEELGFIRAWPPGDPGALGSRAGSTLDECLKLSTRKFLLLKPFLKYLKWKASFQEAPMLLCASPDRSHI